MYQVSEWASEASSITSFGKVRSQKRANNLYYLMGKRETEGKKRRKTKRRRKGKRNVERGQGLMQAVTRCHS